MHIQANQTSAKFWEVISDDHGISLTRTHHGARPHLHVPNTVKTQKANTSLMLSWWI